VAVAYNQVRLTWVNSSGASIIEVLRDLVSPAGSVTTTSRQWEVPAGTAELVDGPDPGPAGEPAPAPRNTYRYRVVELNPVGGFEVASNDVTMPGKPLAPWRHSGWLLQGTFGSWGNDEMVLPLGDHLAHYWRDNDTAGYPWHGPTVLPPPGHGPRGPGSEALAVTFGSVSVIETNLGDEQALTVIATALDTAGKHFLIGYTRDSGGWHGPDPLTADGNLITGISGEN
jgi:hypothetical protein